MILALGLLLSPAALSQLDISEWNTGTPDYIELHNCSGTQVDVSGYVVQTTYSTSASPPTLETPYTLPPGTTIPANGYLILQEFGTAGQPGTLPSSISVGFNYYWTSTRTHEIIVYDDQNNGLDYSYKNYFGNGPHPNLPAGLTWTGTLSSAGDEIRRNSDVDTDDASDWTISAGGGTPAALNPGQVTGVSCAPGPLCTINLPAPGASVSGTLIVDYDADHIMGMPVDALFQFSTDSGANWTNCTPDGASVNPTVGIVVPAAAQTFEWNTIADAVGISSVQTTDLQIVVRDAGGITNTCSVTGLLVDNGPTCTLTLTSVPPVSGEATMDLVPDTPSAATVDATFEFTEDNGVTWSLCTPGGGSTNPVLAAPIGAPTTFAWDSRADNVGLAVLAAGVYVRATVDDLVAGFTGECQTAPFDVDNTSICPLGDCGDCSQDGAGPDIIDALTAAQIAALIVTPTPTQVGCCDVDASGGIDVLDALLMAQAGALIPVTVTCP